MAGENYVLVYVDPALDDGYLIWPLSTEGATVVGFSEVTGCDVVLPIRALIPPLPDPVRNGVQLSATTRVEIKFDKGLQQWCVTSSTSRVGLCSARSANASPTLELPVDGGEFLLRLKTKQESMNFSLVIRRGGMRPNRCHFDVLPDLVLSEISRHLTTDDVCHSLLPAYPHLFDMLKSNVPLPVLGNDGLCGVREAMLALPRKVKKLTLGRRPSNASHLEKLRLLLGSPSLVTLAVCDLTWLLGQKISPGLRELQLNVALEEVNVDIWTVYLGPAVPVPNNITSLAVLLLDDPDIRDPPVCEYLVDSAACFELFNGLENVSFRPPPTDEFWASAPDSALSRLREVTLDFCDHKDFKCCASNLLKHSARFTNLVQLNWVDACDIFDLMKEFEFALPTLQVLSFKKGLFDVDDAAVMRMATFFPSLFHLELIDTSEFIFNGLPVDLPRVLGQLRVIKLPDVWISWEVCLILASQVLKRHPRGHLYISCGKVFGEVSEPVPDMLNLMRMIPSCQVRTTPEVVVGTRGTYEFELVCE